MKTRKEKRYSRLTHLGVAWLRLGKEGSPSEIVVRQDKRATRGPDRSTTPARTTHSHGGEVEGHGGQGRREEKNTLNLRVLPIGRWGNE